MFPQLKHFKASEFKYPDQMRVDFLVWLNIVRDRAGVVFQINSDFRPGDNDSLHGRGAAVDLNSRLWSAADKFKVNKAICDSAGLAPGAVEHEVVWNKDETKDRHWHVGVDNRASAVHEFIEADE